MKITTTFLSLLAAVATVGLASDKVADPSTASRTINYHSADIASLTTGVKIATLVEFLPEKEHVVAGICGDSDDWDIEPVKGTNLLSVTPLKVGIKTDLHVVMASGNVYSFALVEASQVAGAHPDVKVFVRLSDQSALLALSGAQKFVPVEEAEAYKAAAQTATAALEQRKAEDAKNIVQQKEQARAAIDSSIKHDYTWDSSSKAAKTFGVKSIYEEGGFTYIEANPQEAPSLYEIKDGKDSLVQFQFADGRYVIPKVVNQGYMRVGKLKLSFHKEA